MQLRLFSSVVGSTIYFEFFLLVGGVVVVVVPVVAVVVVVIIIVVVVEAVAVVMYVVAVLETEIKRCNNIEMSFVQECCSFQSLNNIICLR